jgi:hypothetical protein
MKTEISIPLEAWLIVIYLGVGIVVQVLIQFEVLDKTRYGIPSTLSDLSGVSTFSRLLFFLFWPVWLLVGAFSGKRKKSE